MVSRIIDGDTFEAVSRATVRLLGVDTPEQGELCHNEATDRLRELAGSTVRPQVGGPLRFSGYTI